MKRFENWKKPSKEELKKTLTSEQYRITQENGTEPPFGNEYWDNHEEGIYVDVVSGEPLFSSKEKFDSGTGWPSFFSELEPDNFVKKSDPDGSGRIEVRSKHANSHLGHLFHDGPAPTRLRFCMDSGAMKFIPKNELVKKGYEEYLKIFQ